MLQQTAKYTYNPSSFKSSPEGLAVGCVDGKKVGFEDGEGVTFSEQTVKQIRIKKTKGYSFGYKQEFAIWSPKYRLQESDKSQE